MNREEINKKIEELKEKYQQYYISDDVWQLVADPDNKVNELILDRAQSKARNSAGFFGNFFIRVPVIVKDDIAMSHLYYNKKAKRNKTEIHLALNEYAYFLQYFTFEDYNIEVLVDPIAGIIMKNVMHYVFRHHLGSRNYKAKQIYYVACEVAATQAFGKKWQEFEFDGNEVSRFPQFNDIQKMIVLDSDEKVLEPEAMVNHYYKQILNLLGIGDGELDLIPFPQALKDKMGISDDDFDQLMNAPDILKAAFLTSITNELRPEKFNSLDDLKNYINSLGAYYDPPVSNGNSGTNQQEQQENQGLNGNPFNSFEKMNDADRLSEENSSKAFAQMNKDDLAEHAKSQNNGSLGALLDLLIEELKPKVKWSAVLKKTLGNSEFCEVKTTSMRENKRFEGARGRRKKRKASIFVALDTSGSVSHKDFERFFSELKQIYNIGFKDITLAEIDADVSRISKYKGKTPKNYAGGGGTYFDPAIEYFNNKSKADVMIYLTDGGASTPVVYPNKLMIWVVTSKKEGGFIDTVKPNGEELPNCRTIQIDDEE